MAIEEHANPIYVFVSSFFLASFAGGAALLRSGAPLNWKSVLSSTLNSGLIGLAIALLYITQFGDNVYFLIGSACLAGMGGSTAIDFILTAIKKGGFSISISPRDGVKMGESEQEKPNVSK